MNQKTLTLRKTSAIPQLGQARITIFFNWGQVQSVFHKISVLNKGLQRTRANYGCTWGVD